MGSSVGSRIETGKYICVAATDMVIELPFTPSYVRLVNLTSFYAVEWYKGMAEPSGLEITNAGAMTLETTTMLQTHTKFNKDDAGTARGFTMGQKANINDTVSEIIQYIAVE